MLKELKNHQGNGKPLRFYTLKCLSCLCVKTIPPVAWKERRWYNPLGVDRGDRELMDLRNAEKES